MLEVHPAVVMIMVVLVTEQHQVVQVRRAAISPVHDVMGGALRGPAPAALHHASPVPHDQGPELPARYGTGRKPDPQRIGHMAAQGPARGLGAGV